MRDKFLRNDTARQFRKIKRMLNSPPPEKLNNPVNYKKVFNFGVVGLTFFALVITMISSCHHSTPVFADTIIIDHIGIDMQAIAQIESSDNPSKVNPYTGATGRFQITQICLDDFNLMTNENYSMKDMFNGYKSRKVSWWYLNTRIPQLLEHYHLPVDLHHILWAYNAGIKKVRRGIMPEETKSYIIKYEDFEENKNHGN